MTLLGPGTRHITGGCVDTTPCCRIMLMPSRLGDNQATTLLAVAPVVEHSPLQVYKRSS